MYDIESLATIIILSVLILIYLYLLLSPNQPRLPKKPFNVVIQRDTKENFDKFLKNMKGGYESYDWMKEAKFDDPYEVYNRSEKHKEDDFFLDLPEQDLYGNSKSEKDRFEDDEEDEEDNKPIIPSTEYVCESNAWLTIRSELNYKYLWMHGTEESWMGASATMETPIHRKAFIIHPIIHNNCNGSEGWVLLQEGDSDHFITMVSPTPSSTSTTAGSEASSSLMNRDAWVIKLGTNDKNIAFQLKSYHWLLEKDGYVLNKELMAFINVLPENDYPVRGHSGSGWNGKKPAKREFGTMMHYQLVNSSLILTAIAKEKAEVSQTKEEDNEFIKKIQLFSNPNNEKRVISFGLYGNKPKYNVGAIKNAELVKTYFPGWICRFYITNDVLNATIDKLKELGSEIESIPSGMGYTSGMFWRFLVADDPTVDRYIVRDVDSRLNARDRFVSPRYVFSLSFASLFAFCAFCAFFVFFAFVSSVFLELQ
jgi:hypothetical protein